MFSAPSAHDGNMLYWAACTAVSATRHAVLKPEPERVQRPLRRFPERHGDQCRLIRAPATGAPGHGAERPRNRRAGAGSAGDVAGAASPPTV